MKLLPLTLALFTTATIAATPDFPNPTPLRPILSCALEDGTRATLKARSQGPDGDALFVQVGDKTQRAFLDMPDSDFVGHIALSTCVDKTLIFALAYGPPYLKGVAIRQNPRTHADERIYFAEKALPRWLYSGQKEMLVIVPNIGQETDRKYLVYRFVAGKGQPEESTPTDQLPILKRDLVRIK